MSSIIKYTDNNIIVNQTIYGFLNTYKHLVSIPKVPRAITNKKRKNNNVVLISGGGSGHEPAHIGFVGTNLLDAAVMGDIFEPPSSYEIFKTIQHTYNGHGTLLIIKNFEKDIKVFLEAENKAKNIGLNVDHVIVTDDCSIDPNSKVKRERGVAGTILVHKILGAASNTGLELNDLKILGNNIIKNTKTLGVAFSEIDNIGSLKKKYILDEDEMYFGIGIHGEPGYRKEKIYSSERLSVELINKLIHQFQPNSIHNVAIMVNGLGSITLLELSIVMNNIHELLKLEDISIDFSLLGNFMTSFNTNGLSITMLNIENNQCIKYLQADTNAFGWNKR